MMSRIKSILNLHKVGCPDLHLQNRKLKQVSIYAFSVLLLFAHLFVKTDTCQVEKRSEYRGTIMSNRYPSPYDSQACGHWLIQTEGRYDTITISFKDIDIPEGIEGSCTQDYLQIGPVPDKIYCGSMVPGPYISHNGTVLIHFYSKSSNTFHRGFSLIYITGTVPSRTPCQGDEFMCTNGKCIYNMWRCNGQFECEDHSDELGCTVTKDCNKLLKGNSGYFTSPNFPDNYDNNLECQWRIQLPDVDAKIQLRFQGDFNVQYNPDTDYVLVYDGPDTEYRLIGTYSGRNKPPAIIESTTNNMLVIFHTDSNTQEQGFNATFQKKVTKDCNKLLKGNSGYFTSPNFPDNYDNNLECQWRIQLPDVDAKIQLRFQGDFNVQYNPDTDYVLVYDGPDTEYRLIGTYSGRNKPPAIIESTTNNMLVIFHTDSNTQEQGFNATFQKKGLCLENQEACGYGENDCFETVQKCDWRQDCPVSGGDERGCKQCKPEEFSCGILTSQCYLPSEKCNGVAKCSNLADEIFCSTVECGSHNGTFLCQNGHCIYERWLCDNRDDCTDLSDEVNCDVILDGSTRRVIIAAIAGSMTCGILLVILLGCACKLYHLRVMERNGGPHHNTPMSRLYAHFMQRRAPPPYHEAMATSRPYDEVQREILERSGNHNHSSHRGQHRSSRSRQNGDEGARETGPPVNCPTVAISFGDDDVLEVPCTDVNRITSELMSPATRHIPSSGSEDSDTASNDISIQLSGASGHEVSAFWSRSSPCKSSSDQESLSGEISNQNNSLQRGDNLHQTDDTFSIETASASINSEEIPFNTDTNNIPKLDEQLTGKNAQNKSMRPIPANPTAQHMTSTQNRRQSDASDSSSLISEDFFDPVINDQASLLHS